MKTCIYHGGCTDGVAAAWVVWKTGQGYLFYPGVYQQDPPWDLIKGAEEVLLVDFAYKRPVIEEIYANCDKLIILDHHKTAKEDLLALESDGIFSGIFDMNRCGSMIAWDYFNPGIPRPDLLKEIDKQDRWLPDRDAPLIMALRSYPHKPREEWGENKEAFNTLMKQWDALMTPEGMAQLRKDASAIYRYYEQRLNETKGHERFITLGELSIPIINAPFFMASDVAGRLAIKHNGIGAVWWQNRDGSITFSLRSRGDFDVGELATQFGGGGHKDAAGFKIDSSHDLFFSFLTE